MVKTVGKYDLYGTLGEGAFGKVKYAVNTETNEAVAIKILDKDKIQARNMGAQIKKEISIMKMINHHHVVAVKDVFATSAKIFIVLEFVGGGELFDKIANEGKLPEDKARFYFKQLVEGLEHCHNNGICHRDLKPENLLLDTDGNLKISDFGFSTLNIGDADGDGGQRAELLHTTCGTPNYVAPEVLGKDGYDGKKADVWSCGVILYVLLAGYLPFDENTMAALFQKIKNADYEFPEWFSNDARDLISKILVPDPHKRPRLADLKGHPWMLKSDSGPSPVHVIDHAAQMGVPTRPANNKEQHKHKEEPAPQPPKQEAVNGTSSKGDHHRHKERDPQPPAVPVVQPSSAPASSKQAPPPIAVDKVNEQFSADKAAIMSTPTASQGTSSRQNSSKPAAATASVPASNGHATQPQQEQPKESQSQKQATAAAPSSSSTAPPQQPATTTQAAATQQEPKKAVTSSPAPAQATPTTSAKATPVTATASNGGAASPTKTVQSKPPPPPQPAGRNPTSTDDMPGGLFCCAGRR